MKDILFHMPTKVTFGENAALKLYQICEAKGVEKVFLVTGHTVRETEEFQKLVSALNEHGIKYQLYSEVVPEPSIEVIDQAAAILKESKSNLVIAVGGGSSIDCAKAISMLANNAGSARDYMFGGNRNIQNKAVPLICVPTTAGSGSEVTGSSVITDNHDKVKRSITHPSLIPEIAVLDPMMQIHMPQHITASTGMDALTHAVEAYTSRHASVFSDVYAKEAIHLISGNLRKAVFVPEDLEARSNMMIGSMMAAVAFLNGGLGAVHGITQAMGGIAHVPHGVANAMMLPHVIGYNIPGNPERFAQIAALMGKISPECL